MAIFFAFFCRKSTDDEKEAREYIDEHPMTVTGDEEYLHSNRISYRSVDDRDRLNENELVCARYHRLKELQMWTMIEELFISLCLLFVVGVMIYSTRDSNSFLQVQHLRRSFLHSTSMKNDYSQVCSSFELDLFEEKEKEREL